jgi:hypothetical protein
MVSMTGRGGGRAGFSGSKDVSTGCFGAEDVWAGKEVGSTGGVLGAEFGERGSRVSGRLLSMT